MKDQPIVDSVPILSDPIQTSEQLGQFIKKIRKQQGVKQQDLADYANLSRVTLVHLEQGQTDVRLSTLLEVIHLLGYELVCKKR